MNICGLILAAGGSSRLGRPKQLVQAAGRSLLENSIHTALTGGLAPVYVCLGARHAQIEAAIAHLPVSIINNENWQQGIGSSISSSIQFIRAQQHYEAVLITLCDQLYINPQHLRALLQAYRDSEKSIIATHYNGQPGVPALFDQQHFARLAQLSGDSGAKKIISQNPAAVCSIPFEQAAIDIDSPEDLLRNGLS